MAYSAIGWDGAQYVAVWPDAAADLAGLPVAPDGSFDPADEFGISTLPQAEGGMQRVELAKA